MTQEEYLKIKKAMDEASEDTTPYVAVVDDDVIVHGDPNETKVEPKDYTAKFLLPESIGKDFPGAKDTGKGYYLVEIEYNGVFVDARSNMKVTSAMVQLIPFYKKYEKDGEVVDLSDDEFLALLGELNDEMVDAIYRIVQVALKIDDSLIGYMISSSAITLCGQIMRDFPNIVNQADLFFD